MLEKLVEKALNLPGKIEEVALELASKKQTLHDMLTVRTKLEAGIAGEVANETNGDGKKRFPNEEARKAEIARRLAEDEDIQRLEEDLKAIRQEVVRLEANLERLRLEFKAATSIIGALTSESLTQVLKDKDKINAFVDAAREVQENQKNNSNASAFDTAKVRVLKTQPGKSEGTVRATCRTEKGEEVTIYAKNDVGKRLAQSIGRTVTVRFKELDQGWFCVAIA